MKSNIFTRYRKMNWQSDDFGAGTRTSTTRRCRRTNKKKASRQMIKDFSYDI